MRQSIGALSALFVVAAASPAAADVCVTCTNPTATYNCKIDGATLATDDPRFKLLCITSLAKSGGHASCSANRATTATCSGETRTIVAPGFDGEAMIPTDSAVPPSAPVPTAAPTGASAPNSGGEQAPPEPQPQAITTDVPKKAGPPKTVKEMVDNGSKSTGEAFDKAGENASDAAKSTGNAFQKAGDAIGNAAKSTWKCLSSMFGEC